MVVAVDERAFPLVPQRPDVAIPIDVQLAELAELRRELVRELIDRGLHDGGAARHALLLLGSVARAQRVGAQPGQVGSPVGGVELRQLLDERDGHVEHVVVLGGGEAAARGLQILEHHHEGTVALVERRVPQLRNPDRELAADRRVQLCLGHSHPDHAQELALVLVERLQLDEQRLGHRIGGLQPDLRPAGGAGVGIDHLDRRDVGVEHLAEPRRCQLIDGSRDGHTVPPQVDAAKRSATGTVTISLVSTSMLIAVPCVREVAVTDPKRVA